jgi:transcriptional regulator with XRE-family HTH domain
MVMDPAEILRAARARALLTQRQLAKRAGIPQSTVAAIESGRRDPQFTTLDRLTTACGYDLDLVRHGGETVTDAQRREIRKMLSLSPGDRLKHAEERAASAMETGPVTARPERHRSELDELVAVREERIALGLDRNGQFVARRSRRPR